MSPEEDKLSFLCSSNWWRNSFILVKSILPKFLISAFLLAVSNGLSIYSDSLLSAGMELGDIRPESLANMAVRTTLLSVAGSIGLMVGLAALSIWMYQLTALSRLALSQNLNEETLQERDLRSAFASCSKKIKTESKHFSAIWMIGFLYLLAPAILLGALIAACILAKSPITVFGQHIVTIPELWVIPIYAAIAILFAISMNYSLVLMVLSSSIKIKPKRAAILASLIIGKQIVPLLLIDAILFVLDLIISAPFIFTPEIPALSRLSHDFLIQTILQLWFAITSALFWPISTLIFAEWLKSTVATHERDQECRAQA